MACLLKVSWLQGVKWQSASVMTSAEIALCEHTQCILIMSVGFSWESHAILEEKYVLEVLMNNIYNVSRVV